MNAKFVKKIRQYARTVMNANASNVPYREYNERTYVDIPTINDEGNTSSYRKWNPITLSKNCIRSGIKNLKRTLKQPSTETRIG
jgi:hypothetical protein